MKERKSSKISKTKRNNLKHMTIIISILTTIWLFLTNTRITTTRIKIRNSKIPISFCGFKIAVIADLHNRDWGESLLGAIKREGTDIVVIVGDFIDATQTDIQIVLDFIRGTKEIAPIYYVSGNNEARSGQYESFKQLLIDEGVSVLDDSKLFLSRGNNDILLLGLQDPDNIEKSTSFYDNSIRIENKLKELIDDFEGYKILLSHRPEHFGTYVRSNIDLALTGHAHGGQFRIPFIGGIFSPNQGFFPKYTSGLYSKNQTDMIVSRGLGDSVIPIRINNAPELVIVELQK